MARRGSRHQAYPMDDYPRSQHKEQSRNNSFDERRDSYDSYEPDYHQHHRAEHEVDIHSNHGSITRIKDERPIRKWDALFPCIKSRLGRTAACIGLGILIGVIIFVMVLYTVFSIPKVEFQNLVGSPEFTFNDGNTTLGVHLVANLTVNNPNPIGVYFELLNITAYYPTYAPPIGGGNITNTDFPSKYVQTIQFPVWARYDKSQDPGFGLLKDLFSKCGKLGTVVGFKDSEFTMNFDLNIRMRILSFNLSPDIKRFPVDIDCPLNLIDLAKGLVPGGGGDGSWWNKIPGGVVDWIGLIPGFP